MRSDREANLTAVRAVHTEFFNRLNRFGKHGLGLSVDVYSPDLGALLGTLHAQQLVPDYLEVFRATSPALAAVRSQIAAGLLTYHGEGLWLTQPEAQDGPLFEQEVIEVAGHLQILRSAWMNHECATKQMAGYTFGTYLPPLYTESSAQIVAENTGYVQDLLDRHCVLAEGGSPLVLLELPPLTYFVAGTVSIPTFFRLVTEQTPCGLVLDIGHLWTVYRYSGAWRTVRLAQFVDDFLAEFPLDRVVEIHVAGLAVHESSQAAQFRSAASRRGALPFWTDAHGASIPSVLFEMLDQVLSHPRLTNLKGLALEVDTKPVDLITDEFRLFTQRYGHVFQAAEDLARPLNGTNVGRKTEPLSMAGRHDLGQAYVRYAGVVSGRAEPTGAEWSSSHACLEHLDTYRQDYLPYEILHWGGEIETMFLETCRCLSGRGVPVSRLLSFWFREPRTLAASYDFFLHKIERFLEFVHEEAPDCDELAEREADELRQAYRFASEPVSRTT